MKIIKKLNLDSQPLAIKTQNLIFDYKRRFLFRRKIMTIYTNQNFIMSFHIKKKDCFWQISNKSALIRIFMRCRHVRGKAIEHMTVNEHLEIPYFIGICYTVEV